MKQVNKYNFSKCTPCQSVKCFNVDCKKCPAQGLNEYMNEEERNTFWSKTHKSITEKMAHERDAEIGLCDLFFRNSNIDPNKIVEWELKSEGNKE